jgi:hypothetical protein
MFYFLIWLGFIFWSVIYRSTEVSSTVTVKSVSSCEGKLTFGKNMHAASTFRAEMCKFRNRLRYIGTSRGRSWHPRQHGKERNPSWQMRKGQNLILYTGKWHTCLKSQVWNWIVKENGHFQGSRVFWWKLELCEAWGKNRPFLGD